MALARRGLKTLAVDIDLSGRLSSSEKNAGGVRATWWQPVNIRLCRASIEYYESIAREVGFRQKGYLWLYDSATWPEALAHLDLQRAHGHPIETLASAEVARRVPEIDKLDGIAGATFSPKDGLINPNLLKQHYRAIALRHGAQFLDRVYVLAIEPGADGVRLGCWQADDAMPDAGLVRLMTQDGPGEAEPGRLFDIHADSIVITGGAWSPYPLRLLGLRNYCEPVRRQICLVDNRATNLDALRDDRRYLGRVLPQRGSAHPGRILATRGTARIPFQLRRRRILRDRNLAADVRADVLHASACATSPDGPGCTKYSPDRSAIVGRAAPRVFEAHSFSGRGVMQSYGAGQALADLIATGSYGALDASRALRASASSAARWPSKSCTSEASRAGFLDSDLA